jgi:hypothetical protein
MAKRLHQLATEMNVSLEPWERIADDDARSAVRFDGVAQKVLDEAAVIVIGAYGEDVELQRKSDRRMRKFHALEQYFAWSRAMGSAAEFFEPAREIPQDDTPLDPRVHDKRAYFAHWMASLMPVIEGWEELKLVDADIDALLASGMVGDEDGAPRVLLRELRNKVFHYGGDPSHPDIESFFESTRPALLWTLQLDRALESYFRRVWESKYVLLDPWLER